MCECDGWMREDEQAEMIRGSMREREREIKDGWREMEERGVIFQYMYGSSIWVSL